MEDLRELSITSLLNDQTVLKLYLDAVEHNEERIMEACSNVIIERFEDICSRETAELSSLIELNLENFIKILNSDNLQAVIVDNRDKPGGHWNDSYSFVRLHQPACTYGVNSRSLGAGALCL